MRKRRLALKSVLFVDPDPIRPDVRDGAVPLADVELCLDFPTARRRLATSTPPEWLVTNLRLGDYNGLHLVYLIASQNCLTRCIVHTDRPDVSLIREAQQLGAFFVSSSHLGRALPSYVKAEHLPARDRRSPVRFDRRSLPRGGRRSADLAPET